MAFVAFGYTLAERYLDMGETDVHVGFSWPWQHHGGHHAAGEEPADVLVVPAIELLDVPGRPAAPAGTRAAATPMVES